MAQDEAYLKAELKIEEAGLSEVKKLNLSGEWGATNSEKLTHLPESLGQLTQLQELNLSRNRLTELPSWLFNLKNLKTLKLSDNQVTSLPEQLGQLVQLRELNLARNKLAALPESLGKLMQLESLNLARNGLAVLPESLGQLTQLQSLDLSRNQLAALPEWLGQLVQLRDLMLWSNNLKQFNKGLMFPPQLEKLDVSMNLISALPKSPKGFDRLRLLSLSHCGLTFLPEWIGDLQDLESLYLPGNELDAIPEHIGALHKLGSLYLGGIHGSFAWTFTEASGHGNRIRELPASLANIHELKNLNLDDNPLNPELAAAYKEGLDAVKRYLRIKAEAQVVLNEAKLILIGEGEVGKSALLGALRGDEWEEKRDSTHGIEIKPVKVTDPDKGTEITLNGWDFGGQRVYRPTHQLFFSAPAVYLVVWKPREGPQQGFVKDWIKLVKHREPDAKILVVATHGGPGARQPDIDRQEIWDLFGKETVVDFFHVDSRPSNEDPKADRRIGECQGIKELRNTIARVAASLPEVGREVPKHWQEARKTLTKSAEAYLPLDRVFAICKEHKVEEEDARLLLRICRRVGDLIHYEHDPALHDIVVLKPDWLATAMSFVLDDENTRANHGLVSFRRLGQLWDHRTRAPEFRYPANLHPIFLRLMERFDLSYRVAGSPLGGQSDDTSLIAQLVPDVRPVDDLAREWPDVIKPGDEQQIQICRIVDAKGQSAAAEGLFFQLIVRLHKLSLGREDFKASVHWQRGLILDDDYNGRALLEHMVNDVRITVRAAYPGNLLAVLTREVKWLVEDFWVGLKCEVVVPCIEPCGKQLPGTGVFEVEKLIESKRRNRPEYPCPVCNEWQSIDCLLQNAPVSRQASIGSLLAEGFGEMRSRLEELRQQNLVLDQGLKRIMSQVDDAFAGVMRTVTDEAKEGPRLFSLQPVEQSKFNPNGWAKKKFRITLWCEHTRLPLPLINKHEKEGVYEFDVTREWFAKASPFLKVLAGTLSLVLPVAASATKLALDEDAYKTLENQLDFGKDCAEAMFTGAEEAVTWLEEKNPLYPERPGVIRADDGVLREFQTWLKKEDASFGDLRRVLNKRQEFLWVHRNFEKEY